MIFLVEILIYKGVYEFLLILPIPYFLRHFVIFYRGICKLYE